MLWSEFLAGLDKVRCEIRSSRGLTAPANLTMNDSIIQYLYSLLNSDTPATAAQKKLHDPPPFNTAQGLGEYAALAPEEEPSPIPSIVNIVDRGEGEGRLIVMGRDKPFVPRKPHLEEVLDEKELGK